MVAMPLSLSVLLPSAVPVVSSEKRTVPLGVVTVQVSVVPAMLTVAVKVTV
jgi:hypothetical protein